MKKKLIHITLGSLVACVTCAAFANPPEHPRERREVQHDRHPPKPYIIKQRIAEQEQAIYEASRNGTLNQKDARVLKHNMVLIKKQYRRANKDDEYMSRHERRRLDDMLNRNEHMLQKKEKVEVLRR